MAKVNASRVAVVGTSHINSIKQALPLVSTGDLPEVEPFFFGLNAPMLSKQNALGWPERSGIMSCTIPEGRALLQRLFSDPNRRFVPADFDAILLVDFFFCYDFSYLLRDNLPKALRIQGLPVSDTAYIEILAERMGQSRYSADSAVGQVPENSTVPLIRQIREAAPHSHVFLTPRPVQPAFNKAQKKIQIEPAEILRSIDLFDQAATRKLDGLDVTYLSRTEEQLCPQTGFTPDRYSAGPHVSNPSLLNEHMNGEYGALTLQQMLVSLEGLRKIP